MSKSSKQAVLLIHSVGEQRPMDTLRGFVKAVWTSDKAVQHPYAKPGVFSKPDTISGSFELRRLTTTQNANTVRTDFYEFYWAHLMKDNTLNHVVAWILFLILKSPLKLPPKLARAWWASIIFLVIIVFFVWSTLQPAANAPPILPKWFTALMSCALSAVVLPFIKNVIGDAARYLHPDPSNIRRREVIRAKGVEIIKKLHDSGQYDRIVVVGHGLGSVIGYDLLNYAFSAFNEDMAGNIPNPHLEPLENMALKGDFSPQDYQKGQRAFQRELVKTGHPWRVTDFVTLGSPLTYADLLLARDLKDLRAKQQDRELPTCPPALDNDKFSYPANLKKRKLHHAAVFGPTRWTNLYFPSRKIVFGDLIGGPLRPLFGMEIKDVEVQTQLRKGLLSHVRYWELGEKEELPEAHIVALRQALNLLDTP